MDFDEYCQLLSRFYNRKNDRKIITLPNPKCFRIGSKKTRIDNFTVICDLMKRPTDHVATFFAKELATSTSINQAGNLNIRGQFSVSQVRTIFKLYSKKYLVCGACKSVETHL